MDFAWVVDALRRGLKVTRKAWAGDPPMYLYMVTEKKPDGKHIIKMHTGTGQDFEWTPTAEQMLIVDDWEEYVEPKVRQEGPFVINPLPLTGTMGMHGGKPVDEPDIDAETNKAIALVARNIAENLVELLRNPSVLRLLQKTDIPLSREDTNHV